VLLEERRHSRTGAPHRSRLSVGKAHYCLSDL
jgi:hypothetical protein